MWKKRTNSIELSSEFHKCAVAHAPTHIWSHVEHCIKVSIIIVSEPMWPFIPFSVDFIKLGVAKFVA